MTMNMTPRLLAATLCISVSPAAFAQDRLETIIVTSVGPDRSADELIGSANSLDRGEIIETLSASLGDTLDRQPGVSSSFFGAGASRPILRGLGAERVLVLTNGIGVIDVSAASPDHQVAADGIDAQRIEILRGPAALAYGGQAIGGVVNVIDGLIVESLPDEALSADAFGANNSVNEGGEMAGRATFVRGPFVFSLSASQRDFDEYEIPGFSESARLRAQEAAENPGAPQEDEARGFVDNSFVETQSLSTGLTWVGDAAFLGVALRQQTSTYGLPGHAHPDEVGGEVERPFIDLEQTRVDLRGGTDLSGDILTELIATLSVATYEHIEFEAPGEPGTLFESDGVEGRIELGHTFAGFEGAAGLQYFDKQIAAFGDEAFITPTDTTGLGVFLYETRDWESGAGIEGGLRFEAVELDNLIAGKADFDLISGSFGLHKHWQSGWFIGGQIGYTERAPNESELFADGPHLATDQYEIGDSDLSKERALNLEASVRWRSDNLRLGANLFVTDFSDFVSLSPVQAEIDDLPVFQFGQQGAQFAGGEIYGEYQLENGPLGAVWSFDASVDFVEAEFDGGGYVPFIPPVTLNAGTRAQWGAWKLGADISIAADQSNTGAGQLATDGYTLVNLRAAFDLTQISIGHDGSEAFLEARNVTDEEVRYSTSVLKDVIPAPGAGIRFGIRLSY